MGNKPIQKNRMIQLSVIISIAAGMEVKNWTVYHPLNHGRKVVLVKG